MVNLLELAQDPVQTAKAAKLRYMTDAMPGISRLRTGDQFSYIDPQGKPIDDEATLTRIRSMALPPAWERVWICPKPNGHLQATGIDTKNRKQYRYHTN